MSASQAQTLALPLFALVSSRYERGSIIMTSNRGVETWGAILDDAMVAAALIDRLIHHATMVTLKGNRYGLGQTRAGSRRFPKAGANRVRDHALDGPYPSVTSPRFRVRRTSPGESSRVAKVTRSECSLRS